MLRFQNDLFSRLSQRHGPLKLCQGNGVVQKCRGEGEIGVVGTVAYDDIVVLTRGEKGADQIRLALGGNIGTEIEFTVHEKDGKPVQNGVIPIGEVQNGQTVSPEGIPIDPARLGAWKIEAYEKRARYLKMKCYITEECKTQTGKFKTVAKAAGFPKSAHDKITWENFHYGTTFTGPRNEKRFKGGTVEIMGEYTITPPD